MLDVVLSVSLLISFAILITHSVRQQWSIVTIAQEYLKHFQCCFWLVFWNPVTSNICECFKHTQDSNINIHQQSDHYHQRTMNPSNIKNRLLETLHWQMTDEAAKNRIHKKEILLYDLHSVMISIQNTTYMCPLPWNVRYVNECSLGDVAFGAKLST